MAESTTTRTTLAVRLPRVSSTPIRARSQQHLAAATGRALLSWAPGSSTLFRDAADPRLGLPARPSPLCSFFCVLALLLAVFLPLLSPARARVSSKCPSSQVCQRAQWGGLPSLLPLRRCAPAPPPAPPSPHNHQQDSVRRQVRRGKLRAYRNTLEVVQSGRFQVQDEFRGVSSSKCATSSKVLRRRAAPRVGK